MNTTSKALLLSLMLTAGVQTHAQSSLGDFVKGALNKVNDTTKTSTTNSNSGSI